jgi:hypothetical protein
VHDLGEQPGGPVDRLGPVLVAHLRLPIPGVPFPHPQVPFPVPFPRATVVF